MWNLKYDTNELIYKTETDSMPQRKRFVVAKEEWAWRGVGLGVWDEQMQTITYRMNKQQAPIV